MRKTVARRNTLSPYAKALKHVAVRGAAALGPTAREQEMKMYAAGTLPADYKPPVQGQWDDTVERWAYSWQYPALEEAEESEAFAISKDPHMLDTLREFAGYLEANPIPTNPTSSATNAGISAREEAAEALKVAAAAAEEGAAEQIAASSSGNLNSAEDESFKPLSEEEVRDLEAMLALEEEGAANSDGSVAAGKEELTSSSANTASIGTAEGDDDSCDEAIFAAAANSDADAPTTSAPTPISSKKNAIAVAEDNFLARLDEASRSVGGNGVGSGPNASLLLRTAAAEPIKTTVAELPAGVPAAYIYDGSFLSKVSIRFGQILSDELGLTYDEEGITTALQALAYASMTNEARQLFALASKLGFAINASMFNALLYTDAHNGLVNPVMKGIEEMKSLGITPTRNTWNLLMVGFTKARDYGAVSQVCDNMKSYANIEPDETTFALQLYALALDRGVESNVAEAIQLFDQMENVYGYVAGRPHYHALMKGLATKRNAAMRERLEMMGTKMEMLGIPWNGTTYTIQMRAAQLWGDTERIKKLFAKLRDDGLPATPSMYSWAIRAHANAMIYKDYEAEFKAKAVVPTSYWIDQLTLCYSIYSLLERRNQEITSQLVDSLLFAVSNTLMLAMEHTPDDIDTIMKLEKQATALWDDAYDKHGIKRTVFSHHVYISMLAHQQRIDEAEKLFQDIVLQHDQTPLPRTYEALMFMHLSSGEEGGTARALQYMEAMERSKMAIRAGTLQKFVRINNEAGYKRDMKRRARRIMQAREEYMARQAERAPFDRDYDASNEAVEGDASGGFAAEASPSQQQQEQKTTGFGGVGNSNTMSGMPSAMAPNPTQNVYQPNFQHEASPSQLADEAATMRADHALKPLPINPNSTLAWWHNWRKETISKHEIFAVEEEDGMPRGEKDADRRLALTAMGIEPVDQIPDAKRQQLLPALRKAEGEVTGALWALDGGELSYPKDGSGPDGWGVQLWRERKMLEKEYQKAVDGKADLPEFSALGVGSRIANDQLAIADGNLTKPGELADYREYPNHLYDDGTLKPASEMAHHVAPSAELVWKREAADPLSPYKAQDELSLEAENLFFKEVQLNAKGKIQDAIEAIKNKEEHLADVVGDTLARRGKHDYLEKWREMYSHGTLEVPDEPIAQFGRSPPVAGAAGNLSQSIRSWYKRNKKAPIVAATAEGREQHARRAAEAIVSKASMEDAKDRKRFKQPGGNKRRQQ